MFFKAKGRLAPFILLSFQLSAKINDNCATALKEEVKSTNPQTVVRSSTDQHFELDDEVLKLEKVIRNAESSIPQARRNIVKYREEIAKEEKKFKFRQNKTLIADLRGKIAEEETKITDFQNSIKKSEAEIKSLRVLQYQNIQKNPGLAFTSILSTVRRRIERARNDTEKARLKNVEKALVEVTSNPKSHEAILNVYNVFSREGYPDYFPGFFNENTANLISTKAYKNGDWVKVFDINGEESGASSAVDSVLAAVNRTSSQVLKRSDIRRVGYWNSNGGGEFKPSQFVQTENPQNQVPRVVEVWANGRILFTEAGIPIGQMPTADGGLQTMWAPGKFEFDSDTYPHAPKDQVHSSREESTNKNCMSCHGSPIGLFTLQPSGLNPSVYTQNARAVLRN